MQVKYYVQKKDTLTDKTVSDRNKTTVNLFDTIDFHVCKKITCLIKIENLVLA